MANDKLIISIAGLKPKIPTEIFLPRLGVSLHSARTKIVDQMFCDIVTVTAIIDEIVFAFLCIKRRTVKGDYGANFLHNKNYAFTFSSCASSASNSRRLGLISRGLPQ